MTNHPNRSVIERKRKFVADLLAMTPDQLAHQYQIIGETMCEEDGAYRAAQAQKMLIVIDAVGRWMYSVQYDEASDRAAAA